MLACSCKRVSVISITLIKMLPAAVITATMELHDRSEMAMLSLPFAEPIPLPRNSRVWRDFVP